MTPERLQYLRWEFTSWLPILAFLLMGLGLVWSSGHPLLFWDPRYLLVLALTILCAIWIGRKGYVWLRARRAP